MNRARKSNILSYNREKLIDELERDFSGMADRQLITGILNNLEAHVYEHLQEAEINMPVQIRLFLGLVLSSHIEPEKEMLVIGEKMQIPDRIKLDARFSKYTCRKMNEIRN